MKVKALVILTTMAFCLSFVAAVSPPAAGPVSSDTWYTNPGDSVQYAINIVIPTPSIQLAVILDGSGGMNSREWSTQINGLHDAIIDPFNLQWMRQAQAIQQSLCIVPTPRI